MTPSDPGISAAVVDAPGAQPRVGSVVLPPRTPATTLLEVLGAPANPLDLLIASGTLHSVRHSAPYVPGSECVGTVLKSDRYPVGSWVYAECHASPTTPGALATQVLVPDEDAVPVPEGVDPVAAAAVGNAGTAGYLPLVDTAGLRPGETVWVLGATGAVGQLAIQIAPRVGAGRVVGVARDRVALERLLGLGADAVVQLQAGESDKELAVRLRSATGEVDVVLDGLYGVPLQAALRVCCSHARVVNVGDSAGPTATIPAGLLRGKQLTVSGFAGLHVALRDKQEALIWLWERLSNGEIKIEVRPFPLDRISAAWQTPATPRTPRS